MLKMLSRFVALEVVFLAEDVGLIMVGGRGGNPARSTVICCLQLERMNAISYLLNEKETEGKRQSWSWVGTGFG